MKAEYIWKSLNKKDLIMMKTAIKEKICSFGSLQDKRYFMSFNISEAIQRLAREYLSKVKCCDECFCEFWCIKNGMKESRVPYKGCEWNVIKNLAELFRD